MANIEKELQEQFIAAIRKKIPEKKKCCYTIAKLLFVEKESVYRRLRGEVAFTFAEITAISKRLNISLDWLVGLSSPYRSHLFQLHIQDYLNLTGVDYKMSRDYVTAIQLAATDPHSEFGFASSVLPLHFSVLYQPIFRLYLLKWMYQFGEPETPVSYVETIIPQALERLHQQYLEAVQTIQYTCFIWDGLFLLYLIHDIQYFNSIRLLTDEEVILIKKELLHFLDHLEELAIRGSYSNGNRVEIYVSNLNFETTYSYLSSHNQHISMIDAFTLGAVTSTEEQMCERIKRRMQALKKTSILITGSEKQRVLFFEKQRAML
jgi:DNA-binding phage protein